MNRAAEAEQLFRRALAIDEQTFGPHHPHVAIRLNNLALALQATRRPEEAEPLYQRALEIDENSLGPNHPSAGVTLNNLASLLRDTNRQTQAKPLYRRALQILMDRTRSTEYRDPNLRTCVMNYVELLRREGVPPSGVIEELNTLGPEAVAIYLEATPTN